MLKTRERTLDIYNYNASELFQVSSRTAVQVVINEVIKPYLGVNHLTRVVSGGTHNAILSVLWLIVMDESLRILDRSKVKVVAFADNLVILVHWMCTFVMRKQVG